jgi:hypothetical protein
VVFVHAEHVEADGFGELELVQRGVVVDIHLFGVDQLGRQIDVDGVVCLRKIVR